MKTLPEFKQALQEKCKANPHTAHTLVQSGNKLNVLYALYCVLQEEKEGQK